jgi:AcrR family transcriptional regulator
MPRKEQLTEFNRNNIIEAAKKLFQEKGISQTTMDEIAKEAEYSKSTIYVYFKSKEEIYNHIIYRSMLMLRDNLIKAIKYTSDYEKQFFLICNALVDFQEQYPLYFESIIGKIGITQKDFEEQPILQEVYKVGEEINRIITRLIQNGIEVSFFRSDLEPLPTMFVLWASIGGIILMASQKEAYLLTKSVSSKKAFLNYGFNMLLHSLRLER